MFYSGKENSEPAGIYLVEISGDVEHKTSHVIVQPGTFPDQVGRGLDVTLEHVLCVGRLLRTYSNNDIPCGLK